MTMKGFGKIAQSILEGKTPLSYSEQAAKMIGGKRLRLFFDESTPNEVLINRLNQIRDPKSIGTLDPLDWGDKEEMDNLIEELRKRGMHIMTDTLKVKYPFDSARGTGATKDLSTLSPDELIRAGLSKQRNK